MELNDIQDVFHIKSDTEFNKISLAVFQHQYQNCGVYHQYIRNLRINTSQINHYSKIPFLPIDFFKNNKIITGNEQPEITFSSSGTSGMSVSKHFVTDVTIYERSFQEAFKIFYGDIKEYAVLALLPSYLEREGSSLIYMVDNLIKQSENSKSGYLLHNHSDLFETLTELKFTNQKTILIGVTYALLDFVENFKIDFPDLIVMETGGMKGKRREMIREELHKELCNGFGINAIHSEYGMTELLSQAYSKGNGIFKCPPWMKVLSRDMNDPLTLLAVNKTGGLNIIDLANSNSCSFIATQDLGVCRADHTFEVMGRFDNSDVRGCNLLVH